MWRHCNSFVISYMGLFSFDDDATRNFAVALVVESLVATRVVYYSHRLAPHSRGATAIKIYRIAHTEPLAHLS